MNYTILRTPYWFDHATRHINYINCTHKPPDLSKFTEGCAALALEKNTNCHSNCLDFKTHSIKQTVLMITSYCQKAK